ncbi:MAG: cyclic-phosphate processing receiver domain-containing protein [Methyloglobulus sp.]
MNNTKSKNTNQALPLFRLLLIEDNQERIRLIESWLPPDVRLVVASSAGRAIGLLKTIRRNDDSPYAGIMLDHDLQDQLVTEVDRFLSGTNVLQFIIQHIPPDVPILVHSMNYRRADDLVQKLRGARFDVMRIPFSILHQDNLTEWLNDVRDAWEDR